MTASAHAAPPSSAGGGYDASAVGALGPWAKAVPVSAWGLTGAAWVGSGPVLADLPTPVMTLDAAAVAANLGAMASWAAGAGVDLAPHGKTSMAPALWRAQLDAGAWAVTLATPWQLAVALDAGVPRVLVAGPLLDADVHGLLARTPRTRVLAWADGEDVVAATAAARARGLERTGTDPAGVRPLDVLVELGAPGARTGARSVAAALAVAHAVAAVPGLRVAGVAGYEGALAHDTSPASMSAVRTWLRDLRSLHGELASRGLLDGLGGPGDGADGPDGSAGGPGSPAVVSAGGSAYFDVVAEELADLHDPSGQRGRAVRVVVRAGASAAHDDGFYAGITPSTRGTGPALRAGLHAWARVISRPEPGLALLDAGRRDLPFDEGLPVVRALRRGGRGPAEPVAAGSAVVTAVNDQHAFVRLAGSAGHLAVGDVLQLGVSHPCTAFDKWGLLPVLDDASLPQPRVVGLLRTVFG